MGGAIRKVVSKIAVQGINYENKAKKYGLEEEKRREKEKMKEKENKSRMMKEKKKRRKEEIIKGEGM